MQTYREKISVTFYQEVKHTWDEEQYYEWDNGNERNGVAWMKAGICKLRKLRRETRKCICPLILGKGDAKHELLRCPETKNMKKDNL